MEKRSLTALGREHLATARRVRNGRSAHTVYGGHEHTLRQTLIALTAVYSPAEHDSPGEAPLSCCRVVPPPRPGRQLGRRPRRPPRPSAHPARSQRGRGLRRAAHRRQATTLIDAAAATLAASYGPFSQVRPAAAGRAARRRSRRRGRRRRRSRGAQQAGGDAERHPPAQNTTAGRAGRAVERAAAAPAGSSGRRGCAGAISPGLRTSTSSRSVASIRSSARRRTAATAARPARGGDGGTPRASASPDHPVEADPGEAHLRLGPRPGADEHDLVLRVITSPAVSAKPAHPGRR